MIRVLIVGIGMGVHHLTREATEALRTADYVIAADKGPDDGLLALRRQVAAGFDLPVVAVPDPARDRDSPADYRGAVADWHRARVDAYEQVLRQRGGTAAFLVWGDPSLYDSTVRVVHALRERLDLTYEVFPGISAPQLLAARHGVVLHEVGDPVHVTTARRLPRDVAVGQRNLVVMLGGVPHFDGLDEWSIWWGANLGTAAERLVAGRVKDVAPHILSARAEAERQAGWVMDVYLLRAPR